MKTRLISGIILVILALAVIMTGGYLLATVLLFLSLIAFRELTKACKLADDGKLNGMEVIGCLGIITFYIVTAVEKNSRYMLLTLIIILMAYMCLYVFSFPKYRAEQIMSSYFCVVYAPVMLSFIYSVRELKYGEYLVWLIFISSWACDTCAYAVGMLFGKHKLAPVLSPKKSIEGAIGGVVGAMIVGALYAHFIVAPGIGGQILFWVFVLISAIGAVVSQIGDLAASAIKRNYGIKDYGKLIPGHGGVMDRFDSVIFTAPVIYCIAYMLAT